MRLSDVLRETSGIKNNPPEHQTKQIEIVWKNIDPRINVQSPASYIFLYFRRKQVLKKVIVIKKFHK